MFALLYLSSCNQCLTEVGARRVPQDSIWVKQDDYLEERFGRSDRWLQFIFEAKEGDLLTAESIRDMFKVYTTMTSLQRQHEGALPLGLRASAGKVHATMATTAGERYIIIRESELLEILRFYV